MSDLVLERVDTADTDKSLDIVFVHGLGGDQLETWTANAKDPSLFWPSWIAEDHPQAAVWSLGYPAKLTKWGNAGDGMALPDRAKQVLDYLKGRGIADRATLFISHSLGGLLVKQLIRTATEIGDARYGTVAETTRGVVFLATPHAGSDLAGLAAGLRFFRPSDEVKGLTAHDPFLGELGEWWRRRAQSLGISTYPYRENKKIKGAWVVDPTSADPGIPGALLIPENEDHFSISKPTNRDHPVYVGVRMIVSSTLQTELTPPPVAAAASEVVMKPSIQVEAAEALTPKLITGPGYVIEDPRPEWTANWVSLLDLVEGEGGIIDKDFLENFSRGLGGRSLEVKDILDVRSSIDYTIEMQAGESFVNGFPMTLFDHAPAQMRLMVARTNRFMTPPGLASSLMTTAVGEMVVGTQAGFTPRSLNPLLRSDGKRALVTERDQVLSRVTVNGRRDTDLTIRMSQVVIEGTTHYYMVSIFTLEGDVVLAEDLDKLQQIAASIRLVDPLDPAAEHAASLKEAEEGRQVLWEQSAPQIQATNLYRLANIYAVQDLSDAGVQQRLIEDIRRVVSILQTYHADPLVYGELTDALELPEADRGPAVAELIQGLIDEVVVA